MQKTIAGILAAFTAFILPEAIASRPAPSFRFFQPVGSATPEADYARYPKTLSATGFFSDIAAKVVGPGAYAFDINSPLWNDGAGKSRYLILPESTVVTYVNDSDEYVFPEGAVFVKHFFFDHAGSGASARTYVETRILVHQSQVWHGFGYKWRKDQSDADLVGAVEGAAETDTFSVADSRGGSRKKKWLYPARLGSTGRGSGFVTCNSCHLNRTEGRRRGILGFITPQLTRLANGKDQIQDMVERGYLEMRNGASYHPSTAHKWYALDDSLSPGSTLEKRARSYLASNCSHCHSVGGNASCLPKYSFNSPQAHVNYINKLSRGKWGLEVPPPDSAKWIFPGKPEYSTLLRRISAADSAGYRDTATNYLSVEGAFDNPGYLEQNSAAAAKQSAGPRALAKTAGWDGTGRMQMPPLATYEVNPLANAVIHAWIESMPAGYSGSVGLPKADLAARKTIFLANGLIQLPEASGSALKATLSDVRGNTIGLSALRPGVFGLPARMAGGVYCLTTGNRRYYLPYFPLR